MSSRTLVIHSGSHKTGSSAIQHYLFEHRQALARVGVNYLYRDKANSSLWMLRAFKADLADLPAFKSGQLDEHQLQVLRKRARGKLTKLAKESRAALSILSAESITTFAAEELRDLHSLTTERFDTVRVHQYFRPLKSRIESAYQERLKHGFASLDKPFPLDYNRRVEMLDGVFGADNVMIYKYDNRAFPNDDVVQHFLSALDIQLADDAPRKPANAGLSLPAVCLLYVYRTYQPTLLPGDRKIVSHLKQLPGPPFRLHSSLYQRLLLTRPESVPLFERRAGFSITENVTEDDAIGVGDEQALKIVSPSSLAWLGERVEMLTGQAPALPACSDLAGVAELVAALGSEAGT